jgi:hypothetical protein
MTHKEELQTIGELMAMLQGVTLTGGQVPTYNSALAWLSAQAKRIKHDMDHPPEKLGRGEG